MIIVSFGISMQILVLIFVFIHIGNAFEVVFFIKKLIVLLLQYLSDIGRNIDGIHINFRIVI